MQEESYKSTCSDWCCMS